jgi:DNA-binding winged helix-turn-helix (wHTH) protein/Flp pilus assembly protein TadD
MTGPGHCVYEFGEFRIETGKRMLLRNGNPVPLTPKVFDTLLHLVQRNGVVLEKEELMRAVWPDTIVEENNLNQNISTLRRVLSDRRGDGRFILTVPGKGYRFVANVEIVETAPEGTAQQTILAVLPFENLGANLEREYLADGLTEEMIATLGQIDPAHLSVIGRTSVMAYKRTTKTAAEIGRELNSAYLIEGSLRAEGEKLRITTRLIRARDQVQVWSASYDSEPSSMLAFQRELSTSLSEAIARQLRLQYSPERLTALGRRHTRNAEAYDSYLRGRHYWHQLSSATTRRAAEYYSRATQLDPNYALAWSGLADGLTASPINGDAPPLAVWPRARKAVEQALRAEPNLAEVQTSVGFLKFWLDWDWLGAESAFRKAIELDPSYPLAHRLLGILLSHMDRRDEAKSSIAHARNLDALNAANHALSSQVAFAARDYATAERFARQAIVVDPEFWIGHLQLAQTCVQLGNIGQAMEALNQASRLSGGNSKAMSLRGYLFARSGREKEAEEVLNTFEAIGREQYVPPYARALIYCGLEQKDLALQWLDHAFEAHDVHLAFLPLDPKWDSFRQNKHSRFLALVERCGFMAPQVPLP